VLPDDVKTLAKPVLSHRLILTERERIRGEGAEGVLQEIMEKVPVPPKIDA
jgi:MoxR-like ATPase